MPRLGIIIEARTSSTRLPGKVTRLLAGVPMVICQAKRLSNPSLYDLVIATSANPEDDIIAELCIMNNIKCFRGSEQDVLDRVYQCAKKYSFDIIIEITGDNPCSCKVIINDAIKEYLLNPSGLLSSDLHWLDNSYKVFIPIGLGVKIFDMRTLEDAWQSATESKDREHVINYMFYSKKYEISEFIYKATQPIRNLRLTVDYETDFLVVKTIFQELCAEIYNFSYHDIILLNEKKPQIFKLNENNIQTIYKYR